MVWDAIVIGGGPAGLAAATWLARYRRRVLVLDAEEPRNRWVEQAHGYLALDPVAPHELRSRALAGLDRYPTATRRCSRVRSVEARGSDRFLVETEEGLEEACRLVLATGVSDAFPDVEGFFTHYGASVFHCPTCDGYEARDADVVVIGWSEQVSGFALTLLDWAASVTIVTDGPALEGDAGDDRALRRHGIAVVSDEATALLGERGSLSAIRLRNGEEITCQLAFFSIAHEPVAGIAAGLGCARDEQGYVLVDEGGATSIAGVFAAGDLTPGMQLVQVAAAKGAVAGVGCALSLRGQPESSAADAPDVDAELDTDAELGTDADLDTRATGHRS